jgi:endonuclease/exonuclease/phosphatase family metal-dependent hydrolase
VSWNAEHPKNRLPDVIQTARDFDADILGITETESTAPADAERRRAAFPGHVVRTLPGFMLLITRGDVLHTATGSLSQRGTYNLVQLQFGARRMNLVFVDFHANPFTSRGPAFAALATVLGNIAEAPTILMGDFNTPRESIYFDAMRERMNDAFETRGNGFAETWPVPTPALSLDHIWVSRPARILRCSHGWSLSDHRPVVADLAW